MPARAAHTRRHRQQHGQITLTFGGSGCAVLQETQAASGVTGAVWRCLALFGEPAFRLATHPQQPKSGARAWQLLPPAKFLVHACLESPMESPWFPVIGVPAPHQTGPPTRTLHDDDHNPDVYFVFLALVAGNGSTRKSLPHTVTPPSVHATPQPASWLRHCRPRGPYPASCMLDWHFCLPFAVASPTPGLSDMSRGHVPTPPFPASWLAVVCRGGEVNGRPHAWLLLDRVPDRPTRRAFRGPAQVRRRPLPLPRCSF